MFFNYINPLSIKSGLLTLLILCSHSTSWAVQDTPLLQFSKESFSQNNVRLIAADELLAAGLLERAIDAYRQLLNEQLSDKNLTAPQDSIHLQTVMQSRFHLAQAYFSLEKYEKALPLLQDNVNKAVKLTPGLESLRQNSLYLLALVYKHTKQPEEALTMLRQYVAEDKIVQPLRKEAQFEMAHIHFLNGEMDKAASQFEALQLEPTTRLAFLRQLYLVRIHLANENYSPVIPLLKTLSGQIDGDDVLQYEISYLLGEAYYGMHAFADAVFYFERALPQRHPESYSWYAETLYYQGLSYLNLADAPLENLEEQSSYFNKAEASFLKLLAHQPQEKGYIALGQYYLARAKRLQDRAAYANAEKVLSQKAHFTTVEGQTHAWLLLAEAAPLYRDRNRLYQKIVHPDNANSSFYGKGWFLHGLNDFEEGQILVKQGNFITGRQTFAKAAAAFKQAFDLLHKIDKSGAATALKYQALALNQGEGEGDISAFEIVDELIQLHPDLMAALEHPDEIYYLRGFFGLRLAATQDNPNYALLGEQSLKQAAANENNKFGDAALNQLAAWHYRNGRFGEAEKIYLRLIQKFPNSDYQAEAWLWSAYCADKLQQDNQVAMQRRRHVFEHYPQSSSAAEAYFTLYTYRDYLQGERDAIKHLHNFGKQYSESPYLMQAYYLIGLDSKRNRKTPEGKWIRKKSLTEAIDAFQKAETLFEHLIEKKMIAADKLEFYTNVYYRVILERAMANLAIADESQGAKQQIYLEYAEEVFKNLLASFEVQQAEQSERLLKSEVFPSFYEESVFWLAQTYIKRQKDKEAAVLLATMLEHYQQAKINRSYYLSRTKYELGKIAARQSNPLIALQHFKESEEAAKGNLLATNEKLDLWIQQSHCYRDLQQYDDAILILSKVANDDAISSLRLKAMYLRADIYELQERPELARKQLESLTKKGGDWAHKAQEKLEKKYAY